MPKNRWNAIAGPLITLALTGLIPAIDHFLFRVPDPGAISFVAVALSAYLGGVTSGLASAAISILFSVIYFSAPGALFHFNPEDLARIMVASVCAPVLAIIIGLLQERAQRSLIRERTITAELKPLRSALDQSEVGVVVLDHDLHAQFINRAYRKFWQLPDEIADSKPTFNDLVCHCRDAKTYAMPPDRIEAYAAERIVHVRAGNERPIDIKLANGDVIRARCKTLSEGGRMITYGNISDLVHSADELQALATTDELTGINNRRQFTARLKSEWSRYRRYRRPLSMIMLDIDHFKSVNDRYGHDVGDQVIRRVAKLCAAQTRDSDVAARIGGEEFATLLPEAEIEDARIVAERLRGFIARQPIATSAGDLSVTVSIGIASASLEMIDCDQLTKRADLSLYAAKRGGRNRVVALPADASSEVHNEDGTSTAAPSGP